MKDTEPVGEEVKHRVKEVEVEEEMEGDWVVEVVAHREGETPPLTEGVVVRVMTPVLLRLEVADTVEEGEEKGVRVVVEDPE